MSVLARDIDAYQRAVDAYNRQLHGYNAGVKQYNQTLVTDPNGNAYIRDASGNVYIADAQGQLSRADLPQGKTVADYGATDAGNGYSLLRQNPISTSTERITNVQRQLDEGGNPTYYIPGGEGGGQPLSPEWRYVSEQGSTSEGGSPTYTFERDASAYMERPGSFQGKLRATKPDPSMPQVRHMFVPTMAAQERGLVSDVIRGNGLATGGTPVQYRSGAVVRDPNQQAQPADPGVDPNPPVDPGWSGY